MTSPRDANGADPQPQCDQAGPEPSAFLNRSSIVWLSRAPFPAPFWKASALKWSRGFLARCAPASEAIPCSGHIADVKNGQA